MLRADCRGLRKRSGRRHIAPADGDGWSAGAPMPRTWKTVRCPGRLHIAPSSATTGGMSGTNKRLTASVEAYLTELHYVRASGGATGERSSYVPLANLLKAIGATLKPKVFCVGELAITAPVIPTSACMQRSRSSGGVRARGSFPSAASLK